MVLTFAVARVLDVLVAVLRVEGDETDAVGKEFVRENGGVLFDFDYVDCNGWNFCENNTAEGVGKGEVDGAEFEVDTVWLGLGIVSNLFLFLFPLLSIYFSPSF